MIGFKMFIVCPISRPRHSLVQIFDMLKIVSSLACGIPIIDNFNYRAVMSANNTVTNHGGPPVAMVPLWVREALCLPLVGVS